MQPDGANEASRWLEQARRDLRDDEYCLEGARYNLACFVAQQAAEKALKAFLYARGEDPWGHSVAELCRAAGDVEGAFEELHPKLAPLDKFYIPTRYPNGLPGGIPSEAFSAADAESAIELAALALDRVSAFVSS